MKRIYMTLGLIGTMATGAFAQNADIEVTLFAPVPGDTTNINSCSTSDSMALEFLIINNGPDDIVVGDTLFFQGPWNEEGFVSYSILDATNDPNAPYGVGDTIRHYGWNMNHSEILTLADATTFNYTYPPFTNGTNYVLFVQAYINDGSSDTTNDNDAGVAIVNWDCPTGINDLFTNNNQSLNVYPNPVSNGTINFKYEFASATQAVARVTDISGRVVMTKDFGKVSGAQSFSLDVSALNAGLYMIELSTDQGKAVSKFSVQK